MKPDQRIMAQLQAEAANLEKQLADKNYLIDLLRRMAEIEDNIISSAQEVSVYQSDGDTLKRSTVLIPNWEVMPDKKSPGEYNKPTNVEDLLITFITLVLETGGLPLTTQALFKKVTEGFNPDMSYNTFYPKLQKMYHSGLLHKKPEIDSYGSAKTNKWMWFTPSMENGIGVFMETPQEGVKQEDYMDSQSDEELKKTLVKGFNEHMTEMVDEGPKKGDITFDHSTGGITIEGGFMTPAVNFNNDLYNKVKEIIKDVADKKLLPVDGFILSTLRAKLADTSYGILAVKRLNQIIKDLQDSGFIKASDTQYQGQTIYNIIRKS